MAAEIIRDGAWTLVEHDPATGRTVWILDHGDGRMTVRTDYPHAAILDANAEALNASAGQRFGNGRRVASIPLNIAFDQLIAAQAQGDARYLSRWLNDADHRAFRTFRGRL